MSGGAPARKGGKSRKPPKQPATPAAKRRKKPSAHGVDSAAATAVDDLATDQSRALQLVYERLQQRFGTPAQESYQAPLDELVFTILSQNTTDTNRDRAWASLWQHFDSWEQIADAPAQEVAEAIKIGGLHKVKSQRIQDILRQVRATRGDFDLDYLGDLDIASARRELAPYKGVGDKSINCILLFSLGLPAFPVDTHVHRILRRLGILETNDLGKANRDVQRFVPDDIAYPLHMNVIRYGREVCHSQRPRCWDCNIVDLCAYEPKNLEP